MSGTLREQLTEALTARLSPQAGTATADDLADVALVVVSPALDERDDEIARLRERWEASQLHCHELIDRAERAESITGEQAGRQAAEARLAHSREALAAFDAPEGFHWDVPTPGEVLDAWRASLAEPAQQQGDAT